MGQPTSRAITTVRWCARITLVIGLLVTLYCAVGFICLVLNDDWRLHIPWLIFALGALLTTILIRSALALLVEIGENVLHIRSARQEENPCDAPNGD